MPARWVICARQALACLVGAWAGLAQGAQDAGLERFVDGVMAAQGEERGRFVGATVAVVQNGRLALAKGYGFADLDRNRSVDENTLFRVGSVSKIFVWMALLQQVAAGNLELDDAVNDHLRRFQLPSDAYQEVTLRHLMTHTPGFEDKLVGLFATGRPSDLELGGYLADTIPAMLYPPGERTAYSNFGAGLAAHLVEIAAEMPWHDYAENRVFRPLGLSSTTMRQTPPEGLRDRLATGYRYVGGGFEPQPFEFVRPEPAGSASSSALDMARLMIELMRSRSSTVLDMGAKRLMLTRAFTTHPDLNGMTLGLYEQGRGGVGHDGDTLWFHSALRMWPEQKLGLFVSFNSDGGAIARTRFVDAFERHFGLMRTRPREEPPGVTLADFTGVFLPSRYPARSHLKLTRLAATVRIGTVPERNALVVHGLGDSVQYLPVTDTVFRDPQTGDRLGYLGTGGQFDRLYFDAAPMMAFERAGFVERWDVSLVLLGLAIVLYLLILLWPFSRLFGFRGRRSGGERLASVVGVMAAAAFITFFVGLSDVADDLVRLLSPTDPTLYGILWLPLAGGLLAAWQVLHAYRAFSVGYWWPRRRVHYAALTVVNVCLAAWCLYWRMVPVEVQGFLPF